VRDDGRGRTAAVRGHHTAIAHVVRRPRHIRRRVRVPVRPVQQREPRALRPLSRHDRPRRVGRHSAVQPRHRALAAAAVRRPASGHKRLRPFGAVSKDIAGHPEVRRRGDDGARSLRILTPYNEHRAGRTE